MNGEFAQVLSTKSFNKPIHTVSNYLSTKDPCAVISREVDSVLI
jgi:hypothetical protein